MRIEATALPGVLVVHREVHPDRRGLLTELWSAGPDGVAGLPTRLVQANHARTVRTGLRGLHWQRHHPQGKLVSAVSGHIVDVVVDLAPASPTFRTWVAVELRSGDGRQLWVPPGYAHGFQALSEVADVVYQFTVPYDAADGRGLRWDDPELGIRWPLPHPILSDKDAALPTLATIDPAELPEGAS